MDKILRIATRKSPLALWQAEFVRSQLQLYHPELKIQLIEMTTQGDQVQNTPLSKVGGKGLFIKELEIGILEDRADIAVHSMKDVPYRIPDEFELEVILDRENPFDAFVSNNFNEINELPQSARVGSCSLRRIVQLKTIRPDLTILDLRGNVNTRLMKLDNGEYDAIILACAGLIRLGFEDRIKQIIDAKLCLPAVGQGALGLEFRQGDRQVKELINPLIKNRTATAVIAERSMNSTLEGGCSAPIGGYASIDEEELKLQGMVGNIQSGEILRAESIGKITEPHILGKSVAKKLLNMGAKDLLDHT